MRLQKYLADRGVASRRACEALIVDGKVKVNGNVVKILGTKVDSTKDTVEINGEKFKGNRKKTIYIALNKPRGYVCTKAEGEGRNIFELVKDIPERLITVGRLDKDSSGLILLTNDGEFANRMTHPKFEKEKEYEVLVHRAITDTALKMLAKGIRIQGRKTASAKVKRLSEKSFSIVIHEGRNKQIRRMCEEIKYAVTKLKRVRIGTLTLGDIPEGKWRNIDGAAL